MPISQNSAPTAKRWGQSQAPIAQNQALTKPIKCGGRNLGHQGRTGNVALAKRRCKDQKTLEAGNEVGQSVKSPGAIDVIGADGNSDRRDNDITGGNSKNANH